MAQTAQVLSSALEVPMVLYTARISYVALEVEVKTADASALSYVSQVQAAAICAS